MKKRSVIFLLIFAMIFSVSCKKEEQGDILVTSSDEDDEVSIVLDEGGELLFGGTEKKSGYSEFIDGLAGLTINYPNDWMLSATEPNYILIANEKNIITIHHNLLPGDPSSGNLNEFIHSFDSMIAEEKFSYFGHDDLQRRELQELTSIEVINDDPNRMLVREYYEDIAMRDSYGLYISGEFSETRYYMRYNNIDTVISLFGPDSEVLDYIVKNIRTAPMSYDSVFNIETSDETVYIPGTFKSAEADGVRIFVPGNTDPLAGCFVATYSSCDKINSRFLTEVFRTIYPGAGVTLNIGNGSEPIFDTDHVYLCSIKSNKMFPRTGNMWQLEVIKTDQGAVVIGYPLVKKDLFEKFELA